MVQHPTLAKEAPLIEENTLSMVPLPYQDPNYPSDRDGEEQWEGEYDDEYKNDQQQDPSPVTPMTNGQPQRISIPRMNCQME